MLHVTHLTIQNGNNSPSLFSRAVSRQFETTQQMADYRNRIGLLARKRYHKEHVTVFFNYSER